MKPKDPSHLATTKFKFIETMYARLINELPEGKDWLYEVKFNGYRCLAGKRGETDSCRLSAVT